MLLQSTVRALGVRGAAPVCVSARHRSTAAATPLDATAAADAAAARSAEWERAKPYHAIPGPKPFPLLGNLPLFLPGIGKYGKVDMLDAHNLIRKEYGDMVRVSNMVVRRDMIFVFDPEIAEKVFRNEGVWPIREGLESMKYYRSVLRKDKYEGAHGLVTSQGKEWHDFRSKVNQPMMQPKSANRYSSAVNDVAEDFINRMRELRDENKELPADFIHELYKWALESIALVALDTRLGCLRHDLPPGSGPRRLIDAVQVMFEGFYKLDLRPSLWRLVSTPMWRRMVAAFDCLNDVSEKYINEAIAKNTSSTDREPSILARVMEKDPKVAKVMAVDMLTAGVDTTSHMTASLLFHLAKNQQVQQRAAEEVLQALPSVHDPVTSETIARLPYLRACFKESLRIFPITIGNIRETPEDMVLNDYQVPKGILRSFQVEYHYGDEISFTARTINTITSPLKFRLIDRI
ncbi:Putative cytochrome P450 301a1, mitochondrial [Gryllus bimaculatus]|nr:Putative cytochrome P450 301a1, mitochondrial [Gryllus bimaculatus]